MENKIKNLKKLYKNETPTQFSNEDKMKIRERIQNPFQERRRKFVLPQILTAAVFAAVFLVGGYWIYNSLPNQSFTQGSQGNSSVNTNREEEIININGPEFFTPTYIKEADLRSEYIYFDPSEVEVDQVFAIPHTSPITPYYYKTTEIEEKETSINITFEGRNNFSGNLYIDGDNVWYVPYENHISATPIVSDVFDKPFAIKFANKEQVLEDLGVTPSEEEIISLDVHLSVDKMKYVYRGDSSIIYVDGDYLIDPEKNPHFYVQKEPTTIYNTSLALDKKLEAVYNKYAEEYDDTLLEGLEPIDVFKLYVHAIKQSNNNARTFLHSQKEWNSLADEWQSYIKPFMTELEAIEQFNVYIVNEGAILTFTMDMEYIEPATIEEKMDFKYFAFTYDDDGRVGHYIYLIKDPDLDVWKINFIGF